MGRRGRAIGAVAAIATTGALLAVVAPPAGATGPMALPAPRSGSVILTSTSPVGELVALDSDPAPDLLTFTKASGDDLTVTARLGTSGVLSFSAPTSTHVGTCSNSQHRVADVDGDGSPDLVLACGANGVDVLLGNGDGSFDAPSVTATAASTVAVGDVTGSPAVDIAAGSGTALVLLAGDGAGTFTSTGTTWTTALGISNLAVADLDAAGKADIVASEYTMTGPFSANAAIATYLADGAGGLQSLESHPIAFAPGQPVVADLDGDGTVDVVVGVSPIGTTSTFGTYVLTGTGGGHLGDPQQAIPSIRAATPVVADLDADGHRDLAAIDPLDHAVRVRFGRGGGSLGPEHGFHTMLDQQRIDAVDVDGDGDLDLVASTTASTAPGPRWVVLANLGAQRFQATPEQRGGYSASEPMAVGDLTGDGHPDVVAGINTSSSVRTWVNDGHGELLPYVASASFLNYQGLVLGHLDDGSELDAVATYKGTTQVLIGNGDGTFQAPLATSNGLAATPHPLVADLDEGGRDELILADPDDAQLLLYRSGGTGALGTPTAIATGGAYDLPQASDVDGDGHLDLVLLDAAGSSAAVLLGNGDGTFGAPVVRSVLAGGRAMALGDVDEDGDPDLVVHAYVSGAKSITTYLGRGDGTFGAGTTVTIDQMLDTVALGDLDGDGNLDVPVGTRTYLLGNGDGTWVRATALVGPTNDGTVDEPHIADLDGDARPDVVGPRAKDVVVELATAPSSPVAAAWAPFDSWGKLVDRFWADLYAATPTAAERNAEVTALSTGIRAKGAEVARIRHSTEHQTDVDPVARLYRAYFLRNADPTGLDHWVLKRRNGATLASISARFAGSPEFARRYGSLTNAAYVALVYQNVLGRPGDASGVSYWTKQLDTKRRSRGQVMLNFSESNEFKRTQVAEADVAVLYTWLLRRSPTGPEFSDAVARLESGQTLAQFATTLLDSSEYEQRIAAL